METVYLSEYSDVFYKVRKMTLLHCWNSDISLILQKFKGENY